MLVAGQNSSGGVRDRHVFKELFSQISWGQNSPEIPQGGDKTGPHPTQLCYSLNL